MKSILAIVPYDPIYPPLNGGMQRCFNVIHQLAKHFELTIIINQKKEGFLMAINEFPAIKKATVYSTQVAQVPKDIFNFFPDKLQSAFRYRWYKKTFKGPADGNFLKYYSILSKLLTHQKFDVIILESLVTLNAISLIRKYDKQVKIIYDAHNVDSNLALVAVEKWKMKKENQFLINKAESSLYRTVNAIFTCSKKDLDDFAKMNGNKLSAIVIPNGVSVANNLFDEAVKLDVPEYILFCGALWSVPNSEGLLWFYNTIWPTVKKSFPGVKLLVVGSGKTPESFRPLLIDTSVHFTGAVVDVKPWYNKSSAAIVPLLSGSGTRLKILEAMSLGLPVISTSKGAEGIDYTDELNIIIANEENIFAEKIIDLLRNKEQRLMIQQNARKLVEENYDWNIIGTSLAKFINV